MSAERIDDGRERGETTGLQFIDRGDIVCRNPELAQVVGVPGEEDLSSGDTTQLRQSGVEVFPVVHRENGECDIKGPVIEGEVLGCTSDASVTRVLRQHDARGLEGDHRAVGWFVRIPPRHPR